MRVTTQLAVVIVSAVLGAVALVLGLAVWADWSDGAIVAMVGAFGSVLVNSIVLVRNQQKTGQVLAGQDEKLEVITRQTNGLSEVERDDVAQRAADKAVRATIAAVREGTWRP